MDTDIILLCNRCGSDDIAATENGLCRDCHQAEHGPAWEPGEGAGEPAFYRQHISDAGRAHLL